MGLRSLTQCNIPFVKFDGLKFLDTAHVKDLLALLRFIENPRDRVAGFRVMQLLPAWDHRRRNASSSGWRIKPIRWGRYPISRHRRGRALFGTSSCKPSRRFIRARPAGLQRSAMHLLV